MEKKIKKVMLATKVMPNLAEKIKTYAAEKDRSVMWVINDILKRHFEAIKPLDNDQTKPTK